MAPVGSLMDAAALLDAAPHPVGEHLSVPERVVVAPCVGLFRAAPPTTVTAEGELLATGQVVGYIDAQDQTVPVCSAFAGWMMGLLVHDGERVRAGQPVAWLRTL